VQADGLVGAARLTAGAFVVDLGMRYVERISAREARSIPGTLEASRKQVLANSFTVLAADVVDGLAMKWRYGA
jgi:hypothetical protein